MNQDITPRGYPLPHPDHLLEADALVLRDAISQIDQEMTGQEHSALQIKNQLTERLHRQHLKVLHGFGF